MTDETISGYRVETAPDAHPSRPHSTAIMSVRLAPNEEVEWHWAHSAFGSYVTGYTIRTKPFAPCNPL